MEANDTADRFAVQDAINIDCVLYGVVRVTKSARVDLSLSVVSCYLYGTAMYDGGFPAFNRPAILISYTHSAHNHIRAVRRYSELQLY